MNNEFKNSTLVIVCGPGENNGKIYRNVLGIIVERDPYYKDYLVRFQDGTEDWFLPRYIRKLCKRKKEKSNEG